MLIKPKLDPNTFSAQLIAYAARTAYEVASGHMAVFPIYKAPRVIEENNGIRICECKMGYKNKHPLAQLGFERYEVLWKFVAQVEPYHNFGWTLRYMKLHRTSEGADQIFQVFIDDRYLTYVLLPPKNGKSVLRKGTSFHDRETVELGPDTWLPQSQTFIPRNLGPVLIERRQ